MQIQDSCVSSSFVSNENVVLYYFKEQHADMYSSTLPEITAYFNEESLDASREMAFGTSGLKLKKIHQWLLSGNFMSS